MPQTIMDDAFIGPYEIPTLEDFHAGVPVPGLAHPFEAKQEPHINITISPELEQHDQHQQAMWEEY
ncbi:MAG: hypothetical protein FRX49_06467 [Trebouxia sp. A1-2]|nr:MAG: hypothetical protein FRX49_06467 [Trebouxia sp. A1-2]